MRTSILHCCAAPIVVTLQVFLCSCYILFLSNASLSLQTSINLSRDHPVQWRRPMTILRNQQPRIISATRVLSGHA